MYFGFALDLSDIDKHLDLLDTDIPSKHFVCLQDVLKTSSRYGLKTSSRRLQDMSSRRLKDVFSVSIFLLPSLLQDIFGRRLQEVFKKSSRRLGRRKIVTLKTCWKHLQDMPWRRLEDVLKTNKCLLGGNSNLSFQVIEEFLNLMLFYADLMSLHG